MTEAHSVTGNARFVANLRSIVAPSKWTTWFSAVRMEFTDETLQVVAPSDFHLHWLQDHYREVIESLAADHLGPEVIVHYAVDEPAPPAPPPDDPAPAVPTDSTDPAAAATPTSTSRFERKYVFDTYVVGQSNRLARAAAMAVADKPGEHYNPLFIYGGAGLGKTHLLHAIGHHARTHRPSASVRYINSENFFNEFVDGIRRKRMDAFKQRYRSIDLLLLDDVQFFQGKEQVLEEVFHTFNTLYDLDRQIVLSCDRPPKDLGIEDRLRSRFQWGLLADIGPPDVETRLAILQRNAEYAPTPVPGMVLEFIAQHVTDNIRELEGALTRVTAYAALTNQPITLDLAKDQLRDLIPATPGRPPTGPEILAMTAATHGFSVGDLQGPSRRGPVVLARHSAMYLCRTLTDLSLPKIGKLFGGRDHSTVSHAIDKIGKLITSDPETARMIARLSEKLCAP
ncbi:MAG: chromosomal replication initiator protein DnaA [bacterium]|nr:chromosomal replication initiator protein DnaA [bacterium]MDE0438506.1 chromosomal replication initiator protein DnaA [bacterium]